jgi:hypothetical protein
MNSKKSIYLIVSIVIVFVLVICAAYILNQSGANSDYIDSSGKYKMNVSYSLEDDSYSLNNGPIEYRTKLSFIATISGVKEDIGNIDGHSLMVNMEYSDLMLGYTHYSGKGKRTDNDFQIAGSILFDTVGMTEKGIDITDICEGIEIFDKDGNVFKMYFPIIKSE